ncbi:uncharacterized protein YqhQ [Sinobaca qinghaiensis]|uniref:Uncharacterized protein YqhQ n=2 Tax=Sinobaca qinghaiensis TaxID=342944 RepID=A0A419V364_9BACL|nr:uncharacterized protein YqhQ [Sinobaca qinghaiensis]
MPYFRHGWDDTMTESKKMAYGGQAIVEGVMFAGKTTTVSAIRRNNGEIEYYEVKKKSIPILRSLKKIFIIRGIAGLIEASSVGMKHLNYASDRYDVNPEDDETAPVEKASSSKWGMILGTAVVGVTSFLFGNFIFTVLPAVAAGGFTPIFPGHVAQNLLEGFFKLILLFLYIYLISLTPMVKRLFQYHGAEHKVINTYEAGVPLTVQNVQRHSRLHYRCGSSFILFTVIVGVLIYLMVPFDSLAERIVHRLALIPVVLGVSYEVLQGTNKVRNIPVLKWLGLPGLGLQLLTTKPPKNDQVEVAILSFEKLLAEEKHSAEPIDHNAV